jgi:hypothetical protein
MLIAVAGGGWRPGDTVFVHLDGFSTEQAAQSPLASATVADDGCFTATFIIPNALEDGRSHALVVARSAATGDEAFEVLLVSAADQTPRPAPTITPTLVPIEPTATPTAVPTSEPTQTPVVEPTPTTEATITDWRGEYYDNRNLTGAPTIVRDDAAVDFDW